MLIVPKSMLIYHQHTVHRKREDNRRSEPETNIHYLTDEESDYEYESKIIHFGVVFPSSVSSRDDYG